MNLRLSLTALTIGIVLLAACSKGTVMGGPPPMRTFSFTRVYTGDGPGFPDSSRVAVRDLATWQSVWAQATADQPTPPPLPQIDFEQEMLLVVAAGQMFPGDEIHVDSVGTRDDQLVVVVRTVVQCQAFPTPAFPVEIVRTQRWNGFVQYLENRLQGPQC